MYKIGDTIKVRRLKTTNTFNGYSKRISKDVVFFTEEIITEIFDSMDKTFKCFFVKGSDELITENMLA